MAAAVAARDKAVQDRAAASAAYNQQLLQTLDGFRGTHLDPNASHWDEVGFVLHSQCPFSNMSTYRLQSM